jgi:hypothetical protein
MKISSLFASSALGAVAHIVLGLLINLASAYPLYDNAATGTLGDPLPMQAIILTVGGLISVVIDFIVGYRTTGQVGVSSGAAAFLAHAVGGFITGLGAFVVLLVIYGIIQQSYGSSVAGLGESYHALMLIFAAIGLLIGWVFGIIVAAIVGAMGGVVGRGRVGKVA